MAFTIGCVVIDCSNRVELPEVKGGRLSLKNMTNWSTGNDGWHCPEHRSARLAPTK